jgi:hypothetical protein
LFRFNSSRYGDKGHLAETAPLKKLINIVLQVAEKVVYFFSDTVAADMATMATSLRLPFKKVDKFCFVG